MLFFGNSSAVIVFLIQILLLCSFGQRINTQCDLLSTRLYESQWPDIIRQKRLGLFLLIFSNALEQDCVMVIGKLLPLVLTTFASVSSLILL